MKFDIDDEIRVGISRFTPIFKVVKFNSEYKVSWKGDVAHNGTTIEVSKTGSFILMVDIFLRVYVQQKRLKE